MKKMLVNLVNMTSDGIPVIWLIKLSHWQSLGYEISVQSGLFIKKIDLLNRDVYEFNYSFKELEKIPKENFSKISYIIHALKRNFKVFMDYKKVKEQDYNIIYTPSSVLEFILFPSFFCRLNSKLKWVTVFDNAVPFSGPGNKFIRFLAWIFFQISLILLRNAYVIYVITPDLKKFMLGRGFKEERLVVTGCAVETELIKSAKADEKIVIDILFVGRIHEKKGIYDMLEALRIITKKMPGCQLAIMGEGEIATVKKFKEKISKLGLQNNVQFLGYRRGAEKFNIIKSSKLFWFFSYDESFGVALLEAVCMGKMALVYDLDPYKFLYRNEEVIVMEKGDYQAIADKTTELIVSDNLMNNRGLKLVDKFDWNGIVDQENYAIEQFQKK